MELSQLFQNLGLAKYMPAEEMMLKYVPKASGGERTREGAIWGLGWLHEGAADAGVAQKLTNRLVDMNILNPESRPVRAMCAVSLGRMRDKSSDTKGALTRMAAEEAGSADRRGVAGGRSRRSTARRSSPAESAAVSDHGMVCGAHGIGT